MAQYPELVGNKWVSLIDTIDGVPLGMTKLLADYGGMETREIAADLTRDEAEKLVLHLEDAGTWPEGFDAVYVDDEGISWTYADGWEHNQWDPS